MVIIIIIIVIITLTKTTKEHRVIIIKLLPSQQTIFYIYFSKSIKIIINLLIFVIGFLNIFFSMQSFIILFKKIKIKKFVFTSKEY